jgi:hexosaminidase
MKRCLLLMTVCLVAALGGTGISADKGETPLALVPLPLKIERKPGTFTIDAKTQILFDKESADAENVAGQLAERLHRGTGLALKVSPAYDKVPKIGAIVLSANANPATVGPEGYVLNVSPARVEISASDGPGLFYGMQTLLQLLPPEVFSSSQAKSIKEWKIPEVLISDQPRFQWRGLLLDVARHFFNKEELKNYIDLMSQHKLNMLQLHLSDDNGWRIEIKRYPKLTEVGAWRKETGFGLDPKSSTAYGPDGRYGGFFTQDDIREIVAYAKTRYVTIVPEIEMPGHAGAELSVYPEFSCFGGPYDRDSGPMGIFCPGNEAAFTFLENVLVEVAGLFPGKYIHIGGDEVIKDNWEKCPKCQARMKQEGLQNANELQSYFVKRIERVVNGQGKTMIGWDEILEGGLAPNAVVMSWRGIEGGVSAANAGHDVVMTPTSHCYFDFSQAKEGEPESIGSLITLETVYGFDPMPLGISADKKKHVLGAGGNLWSEFFPNYAHVQYMTYPRACALAEATWTDPKLKRLEDFKSRLDVHLKRLEGQGVNYRRP